MNATVETSLDPYSPIARAREETSFARTISVILTQRGIPISARRRAQNGIG